MDRLIATSSEKKIVILAGSTGRFSHRCQTIEEKYGISCTNMAVAVDISLSWQFDHLLPFVHKGDLIYLPLEYSVPVEVGTEAPYLARFSWAGLMNYPTRDILPALFFFDLRYLFSATAEMALSREGVSRRYSLGTLTPQGDESGNTRDKAADYAPFIKGVPAMQLSPSLFDKAFWGSFSAPLISARAKGVIIVGGLPTVFDETNVSDAVLSTLRDGYARLDACFISLPNRSQYQRSDFYDTAYHLNEDAQIRHSVAIGAKLADIIHKGSC